MQRNHSYQHIMSNMHHQSPKDYYHLPPQPNNYGLKTPRSSEKKNLIDQIINKCEKYESPRVSMNKCPAPRSMMSPGSRTRIIEDKENILGSRASNGLPHSPL